MGYINALGFLEFAYDEHGDTPKAVSRAFEFHLKGNCYPPYPDKIVFAMSDIVKHYAAGEATMADVFKVFSGGKETVSSEWVDDVDHVHGVFLLAAKAVREGRPIFKNKTQKELDEARKE